MISQPPKGNDAKVLGSYFSPLKAEAQATPNNTVKVSAGSFWLADKTHQEYIGGTSPAISAPSLPSTAAWVIITITPDGVLNVVEGLPTASPVLPDPSEYVGELPIAAIYLLQSIDTVITSDMVFDIRPLWVVQADSVSQSELDDFATIVWVNNQLAAKADVGGTPEPTFILNSGAANVNYSGIEVDRDTLPSVGIRFNETAVAGSPPVVTPHWEYSNDGVAWDHIGVASDNYYTKTESDALYTPIAHATDPDLHLGSPQNIFLDGLTLTGSPALTASDVNQLIGITGNVQGQFDTHLADMVLHISADQNTFLDGLTLTGSPALAAADVNQLIGIAGNVQTLLDAKLDDVVGVASNIAILNGAGELSDSGWTLNDGGGSPYSTTDLWSANKIDAEIGSAVATLGGTKADKIVPAAVGNIAGLDGTGNLTDTTWTLNDAVVTITDMWSGQKVTTELATKLSTVAGSIGNITEIGAAGQVVDSGTSIAGLTGSFVDLSTPQTVGGNKTFSDNIIINGNLTVGGGSPSSVTLGAQNLTVDDKNITINAGFVGATTTSTGGGLQLDRNVGTDQPAMLVWDDTAGRWEAGLNGLEDVIALDGVSLFQPFYEIQTAGAGSPPVGSPVVGQDIFNLGFQVKTPIAGTAALQVFVNGIKQIEGKAYAIPNYTGNVIVTFALDSIPTPGADVEFYGFGYIG